MAQSAAKVLTEQAAPEAVRTGAGPAGRQRSRALRFALSIATSLGVALALAVLVELLFRGSTAGTLRFFTESYRPGWSTIAIYALTLLALDAILGRRHQGLLILAPLALGLAWAAQQKSLYLGDPLYPSDLLFANQVVDLWPLLAGERPLVAAAVIAGGIAGVGVLALLWMKRKRLFRRIPLYGRGARLAVALPLLALFALNMDAYTYSWYRDRLWISPMMWDQTANYDHNGFTAAFLLNIPMAKVKAPAGYSEAAMRSMTPPAAVHVPATKPDIIIVMSESFWDPTRLPGVSFSSDPIATARRLQSGHVFSPEFGGMTANVEFEALTGFSNAFLPFGGIPYQQYVRRDLPSLASFLGGEGYVTRALHPFRGGFWNRTNVYEALGFQAFKSEENLPALERRGGQVSDIAFGEEIIREAEAIEDPFFLFAVTIQGHGPYPGSRYPDKKIRAAAHTSEEAADSIASYAEGVRDADKMLADLVKWARNRDRETIIVYFGDHLPPLGPAYMETGFLDDLVAPRTGPAADMRENRETPLVIWSNRLGRVTNIGTVSPSFLPLHVLEAAGFNHPYYTGTLRDLREQYSVIDRYLLIDGKGDATPDWQRQGASSPALDNLRRLQFDVMFGERHAAPKFFPKPAVGPAPPLTVQAPFVGRT
ncbi:MAG TPA: LTA synthase family protein [Rhizobiaceae bacterium]|nr:LTA synthase family protein [Rhizobiaceae bacterium]